MKWIECNGLTLDCEQILYRTDTPEIFVCKDQKCQRYLVFFEDDTEYLVVPVSSEDIQSLVCNEITICECMRKQTNCFILDYSNNRCNMNWVSIDNLDSDLFPEEGIYIDAPQETRDYYTTQLGKE